MRALLFAFALAATGCVATAPPAAQPARGAGDMMVVANRPNNLHLVDLAAQRVERSCTLPSNAVPGTIALSPDNAIAYIIGGGMGEIWGVRLADCALVFSAVESQGNERVRTLGGIAVSPDGKRLYTHQAPVKLFVDHYEVQPTRIAIYDTSAGTDALPLRTLPAPRQVTIIKTGADGTLFLGGPDIVAMDPETGAQRVALLSRNRKDPAFGPRDVLTVWNIGESSGEFVRMFSAPRWKPGAEGDAAQAELVWGYERVDLATGIASDAVAGPLLNGLFTGMTRPGHPDQFYATLTQLQRFDVPNARIDKSVDLEHSYYAIDFGSDGDTLYLTGTFNDIAIYDADSMTKLGNIVLPGGDMATGVPKIFRR
ncbi:MAG: quinohemoprotein amine dehydrogenase subunit beta [Myxococcota bacterium]|jgi:quinohemoprotein amine dehydrogenase beta subunit